MSIEVSINSPDDILIAKDKDNGKEYYVLIEQDTCGCEWIQNECPVGHLITWHRNYCIGEQHNYGDAVDFFRDLISTHLGYNYERSEEVNRDRERKYFELLLDYAGVGIFSRDDVKDLEAYKKRPRPYYEDDIDAPLLLCRLDGEGKIIDWPYVDGMSTDNPEDFTEDDKSALWEILYSLNLRELNLIAMNIEDIVVYPVFMYDHSGIALSISNTEYPFSDRWDSGQIGYWWATKEEVKKELSSSEDWRHSFYKYVEGAIEEFNMIESGNTWGFVCAPREELDPYKDCVNEYASGLWDRRLREAIKDHQSSACWGYIGNYEDLVKDFCSDEHLEITGILE